MIKGVHQNIEYKIQKESGKYKPMTSIRMGVCLPVAIDGVDIKCADGKYLTYGEPDELVVVAEKIIDELLK